MRRKLVVGNWKMHGSRPANAELLAGSCAAGRTLPTWRCACRFRTSARPRPRWPAATCAGARRSVGARAGRLHRRGLGGDAARVRLPLRHRRPQRAPRSTRRERPAGGRQGAGRAGARRDADRLRRRDAGGARSRPDRGRRQAPAVGRDPHAGALRRRDGRGLRAGVGHRHRPHRHARAGAGGARGAARAAAGRHARTPTR